MTTEYSLILLKRTAEEMRLRLRLMKSFVPEEVELMEQMQKTLDRIEAVLNEKER